MTYQYILKKKKSKKKKAQVSNKKMKQLNP